MKLLLLIVTVIGFGPPHGSTRTPSELSDATVTVTRGTPAQKVAESTDGQLSVRLRPGLYTVVALLNDEPGAPPRFCEATAINVQRQHQSVRRLKLECSIK